METPMVTSLLHSSDELMAMMKAQTRVMDYAQLTEMSLVCLLDCSMVPKTASTSLHTLVCPHH